MLSQTIDEVMSRAKRFESLTRATKFSSAFKGTDNIDEVSLMQKRISKYSKSNVEIECSDDYDIDSLIVEDPDEYKVEINLENDNELGLPFFKSVMAKLDENYQAKAVL